MTPGLLLKLGGTVAGLAGGLVTALWEVFLSPLYLGRIPVPLSPVLAVAGNLALVWFVRRVTASNGLAILPGVAWFIPMLIATTTGRGGDTLIPTSDWMGLITILAGAGAWGVAGYWLAVRHAATAAQSAATGKPAAADSGSGPAADAGGGAATARTGAKAQSGAKPAVWSRPAPGARPGGSPRRRR